MEKQTIKQRLWQYRDIRAFNVESYVTIKTRMLNSWFRLNGLDTAVVGVSGGVDSCLVTALLAEAAKAVDSPIKHIVAVSVPLGSYGATNQDTIADYAHTGISWISGPVAFEVIEAKHGFGDLQSRVFYNTSGVWEVGQMLSVYRTPVFYGIAAREQACGRRSVVVGTTNRDEGAYLGFMGKASDAMVDLQPISDIHKGEVIACLKHLGAPDEVLKRVPRGDVHDGRTDRQMIGAPYWYIEFHLNWIDRGHGRERFLTEFSDSEARLPYYDACEILHEQNAHKYRVGNQSVHLPVYDMFVRYGWSQLNCPGATYV